MTAKWQYKLKSFEKVKLFALNTKNYDLLLINTKIQIKIYIFSVNKAQS